MNYGLQRYNRSLVTSMTPRQVEAMAFSQSITMLESAKTQNERLHALSMNQKLWSAVLREVGVENNGMPEILRGDLFKLSMWATRYCVRAMLHNISLKPLIDINRDMLEGLRERAVESSSSENPAQAFRLATA
ncbi:flagellin assembly protein [Acetobacter musti]|uniref:Flagellin assembly protein n=1 Tax=Acetobacter musti TaxID=864732 RepID=A0ABX0JQ65_9PROT|nr:flagellar biosynthesis regulator FlaF [Acetobacter musti]NHN84243.1 flagellin assembly protein [Acetobacter musti]